MKYKLLLFVIIIITGLISCDKAAAAPEEPSVFIGTINNQEISESSENPLPNRFEATVSGASVLLRILLRETTLLTVKIQTSESASIPGTMYPSAMTLVDSGAGFQVKTGTVSIWECPRYAGQAIHGTVDNAVFMSPVDETDYRVINGSFTLIVTSLANPNAWCTE